MSSIGPRTEAKELVALALAHRAEAGTAGEGSTADHDDARVGVGIASLADDRPYTSEEDEALSNEIDAAVARANATAKAAEEDAERAKALMAYRSWRSRRSDPKLATPGAREGSPVATHAVDDAHHDDDELDPSPPQLPAPARYPDVSTKPKLDAYRAYERATKVGDFDAAWDAVGAYADAGAAD